MVSLWIFLADIEILFIKVIYLTSKAIAHDLMAFFGRSWNFKDMFLSPSCLRKVVKGMTSQTLQARRYSFWLTSLLFEYFCSTKFIPFVSYSSENTEIGVNLCKVFYRKKFKFKSCEPSSLPLNQSYINFVWNFILRDVFYY